MPRKMAAKSEASLAIGAEARQLLALMAEKSGTSPSAVLESAIREKAQRENVTLPVKAVRKGTRAGPVAARRAVGGTAVIDLRPLAARAAAGDDDAAEELKRIIAELRATAVIKPAKPPEELDPGWRDQFLALVDQVRRGVPEEWTEGELQEEIAQAIAEVRASRARDH